MTDALGNYTLDVNLNAQPTFRLMEQGQLGWAQIFNPAATANEPTAAHPYYTLTFTDGDQRGKSFGNHPTNFVVTTARRSEDDGSRALPRASPSSSPRQPTSRCDHPRE